ncbi:MAG: glycoside hydrolase family 3 N-terminal domain-containing protein [Anaerolineae bacterium]
MKHFLIIASVLLVLLLGCQPTPATPAPATAPTGTAPTLNTTSPTTVAPSAPNTVPIDTTPPYRNPTLPIAQRVEDLLARMTLEEKIGQMTQVENGSIRADDITARGIGSLLSGGDGAPRPNNIDAWQQMVDGYQQYALKSRLGIPLIYGVDAVHGFGGLNGATVFPHNIALGATRDPDLLQRIGRATAEEMVAAGIPWNFGPVVAIPQDIRWGRTYEGYSENTDLVTRLATAYIHGQQEVSAQSKLSDPLAVISTAKHFIGDGGTKWGTSRTNNYKLDQGDMQVDEATLRRLYLPPYKAAVDAGVRSVMVSFSSWNGAKMHAQQHLITDVLKGELGFKGFVVSDWAAINQITPNYDDAIATSINAGLDMIMVPDKYPAFIDGLARVVKDGKVPQSRIDDAVRRILTVKFELGLFERPLANPAAKATIRSDAHLKLAREAVQKSLVLLKNENNILPLSTNTPVIFIAGLGANDMGMQSGGWTLAWQGKTGNNEPGTTILDGIKQTVGKGTRVEYNRFGKFDGVTDASGKPLKADAGIVVVGESPYAEGIGDRADLTLALEDIAAIDRVKAQSNKLIVVVLSGRPLVVADELPKWDALIAAWLPGTEGQGVADGLFGVSPFTGKTPYSWPRSNKQLPFDFGSLPKEGCDAPLFAYGFGLGASDPSPKQLDCPGK